MSDKIDIPTLCRNVESIDALPTVPSTLRRISIMMEKPSIGLDELGRLISNDPALTAKILRMINSAAYGFPGRISSVSHATMLLGLSVIKGLLIGVSVFELMEKTMIGLWEHSMGCTVAARMIAQKKGLKEPEEVSVCGLLHDIGKAVLMLQYADVYDKAMQEAEKKGITIHDAERIPLLDAQIKRLRLDISTIEMLSNISKEDMENPTIVQHYQHYDTNKKKS